MKNKIEINSIHETSTIRDAIARLNSFNYEKSFVLFVLDKDKKLLGSVSDGDVRRALLEGKTLDSSIKDAMRAEFFSITSFSEYIDIKKLKNNNYKIIPYLDKENKIIDLIEIEQYRAFLPLDVFILAGGKGLRLQPHTKSCPKSMLELGGKPIIAHNIDRLIKFGVRNFFISVNYLKEQIIQYITENYKDPLLNIYFIEEEEALGTMGSLSLVPAFKNEDLLIINSDILTNIDFEDFYLSFKKNKADMTVATFDVKIDIPYGVLEIKREDIVDIIEKPSFSYPSSAGIYLMQAKCAKNVPEKSYFDATDLIKNLIQSSMKITHFPIVDYWLDIGNSANYAKAKRDIMHVIDC